MTLLLKYLAEMEKTVTRYQNDSSDPVHFGLRPLTAFPFAAAAAYASFPEVDRAYVYVSAWGFLRNRYKSSKNFDRKERLTNGFIGAWRAYLDALLDKHLEFWLDMDLDAATRERVTQQHAIQKANIARAFAVPTPLQCQAIDRIRNHGRQLKDLLFAWHKDRWIEFPEAEAIVLAEMGYTSPDPRKELSQM
ncbi:MAG: hypothetical protein ACK5NX_03835 [Armatimonadota bacterium]